MKKPCLLGEGFLCPHRHGLSAIPCHLILNKSPHHQHLPVHFIHGLTAAPQPAVAAVAHEGQDGTSACDSLHHGLEVEQAAVGSGQNCKGTRRTREPHPMTALPLPRARRKGREGGKQERAGSSSRAERKSAESQRWCITAGKPACSF